MKMETCSIVINLKRLILYICFLQSCSGSAFSSEKSEFINSRYGYKFTLPDSTCIFKEASRLVSIYKDNMHMDYALCILGVRDKTSLDELTYEAMVNQIKDSIESNKWGNSKLKEIKEFKINSNPAVKYFYKIEYFENAEEEYKEWIEKTFTTKRFKESLEERRPMVGSSNWIGMHSMNSESIYAIDCDIPDEYFDYDYSLINEIFNSFSYIPVDIYHHDDIKSVSCRVEDVFEMPDIPKKEYSKAEINNIRQTANKLQGNKKNCIDNYIDNYKLTSYKHCVQTGYADARAGGCAHGARLISIEVIAAGLEECGIEVP
jgi:hypothetical protein